MKYSKYFVCLLLVKLSLYCYQVECISCNLTECLEKEYDLNIKFKIQKDSLYGISGLNLTSLMTKCSAWKKKDSCVKNIYEECEDSSKHVESDAKAEPIMNLFNMICHPDYVIDYSNNSHCLDTPEFENLHNQVISASHVLDEADPTGHACSGIENKLFDVTALVLKKCGEVAAKLKRQEIEALITPLQEQNACSPRTGNPEIAHHSELTSTFSLIYILPIALGALALAVGGFIAIKKYRERSEYDEMIDDLVKEDELEVPLTSMSEPSTSSV